MISRYDATKVFLNTETQRAQRKACLRGTAVTCLSLIERWTLAGFFERGAGLKPWS
jgi:hypothetical protein